MPYDSALACSGQHGGVPNASGRISHLMATLLEHIKGEWEVLSKAPLTFILLLAIGILSGVGIGEWRDSGQMASLREQVNQANGRISRYRVAL